MKFIEIESVEHLEKHLEEGKKLENIVFQSVDLTDHTLTLLSQKLENCVFLGCKIDPGIVDEIIIKGALVFPSIKNKPYRAFRNSLYIPDELINGYENGDPESIDKMFDSIIYEHYIKTGKENPPSILETFARRLHDHSITDALDEFIEDKKVVAVMGGHSVKRDEENFLNVSMISKKLTERGYLLSSGGGPGAMEATHFGAWMSYRTDEELSDSISILSNAPDYKDKYSWIETALEVKTKYPLIEENGKKARSLGVPTWLYGHEPPTIFATDIAKYFANSVREDGLLAIALHGVIFTPGSAGTVQEIFQDCAQNHYKTSGMISPMVFFGKNFWNNQLPAYDLLKRVAKGRDYEKYISITDDIDEVVEFIEANIPT